MITETKDKGITRFEIGTTRPDLCRKCIEESGCVKIKDGVADTINYEIDYKGIPLHVMSTPTRTVIYGQNRYAMMNFIEDIKGSEKFGTSWVYDDSMRADYQSSK